MCPRTLAPKPEHKKTHTHRHENAELPSDIYTNAHPQKKSSTRGGLPQRSPGGNTWEDLRQTSMTATAVFATLTHTCTSCHLSPCISGLINSCCGFRSCLFLSCGAQCLRKCVSASVTLPVPSPE